MLPSRRRFLSALPALAAVVLSACEAWRGPLRVGANLWSGYAGLDGPGLRAALKNMVLPDLAGNRAMLGQGEGSLAPTLKRLKDLLNGRGLLPLGAIEVDRLLDPSFVNRVAG